MKTKRSLLAILVLLLVLTCVLTLAACKKKDPAADHLHSHVATVTPPTCVSAGYTTYTCACGDTYTADSVPATGRHTYVSAITTYPSATTKGVRTLTCSGCGATRTEDIAALSASLPRVSDFIKKLVGDNQYTLKLDENSKLVYVTDFDSYELGDLGIKGTVLISVAEATISGKGEQLYGHIKFEAIDSNTTIDGSVPVKDVVIDPAAAEIVALYLYINGDDISIEVTAGGYTDENNINLSTALCTAIAEKLGMDSETAINIAYLCNKLASAAPMMEALLDSIASADLPSVSDEYLAEISTLISLVGKDIIVKDEVAGEDVYTVNLGALSTLLEEIDGKTVADYLEEVYGEDVAGMLFDFIRALPNKTGRQIADAVILFAEEAGVDAYDILEAIEIFVAASTGYEINIIAMIEENANVTLAEFIAAKLADGITPEQTLEQLTYTIDYLITSLESLTFNQIIATMLNVGDPSAAIETLEYMLGMIESYINDMATVKVSTDEDGRLEKLDVFVNGEGATVSVDIDMAGSYSFIFADIDGTELIKAEYTADGFIIAVYGYDGEEASLVYTDEDGEKNLVLTADEYIFELKHTCIDMSGIPTDTFVFSESINGTTQFVSRLMISEEAIYWLANDTENDIFKLGLAGDKETGKLTDFIYEIKGYTYDPIMLTRELYTILGLYLIDSDTISINLSDELVGTLELARGAEGSLDGLTLTLEIDGDTVEITVDENGIDLGALLKDGDTLDLILDEDGITIEAINVEGATSETVIDGEILYTEIEGVITLTGDLKIIGFDLLDLNLVITDGIPTAAELALRGFDEMHAIDPDTGDDVVTSYAFYDLIDLTYGEDGESKILDMTIGEVNLKYVYEVIASPYHEEDTLHTLTVYGVVDGKLEAVTAFSISERAFIILATDGNNNRLFGLGALGNCETREVERFEFSLPDYDILVSYADEKLDFKVDNLYGFISIKLSEDGSFEGIKAELRDKTDYLSIEVDALGNVTLIGTTTEEDETVDVLSGGLSFTDTADGTLVHADIVFFGIDYIDFEGLIKDGELVNANGVIRVLTTIEEKVKDLVTGEVTVETVTTLEDALIFAYADKLLAFTLDGVDCEAEWSTEGEKLSIAISATDGETIINGEIGIAKNELHVIVGDGENTLLEAGIAVDGETHEILDLILVQRGYSYRYDESDDGTSEVVKKIYTALSIKYDSEIPGKVEIQFQSATATIEWMDYNDRKVITFEGLYDGATLLIGVSYGENDIYLTAGDGSNSLFECGIAVDPDTYALDSFTIAINGYEFDHSTMISEYVEFVYVDFSKADKAITFGIYGVDGKLAWFNINGNTSFALEVATLDVLLGFGDEGIYFLAAESNNPLVEVSVVVDEIDGSLVELLIAVNGYSDNYDEDEDGNITVTKEFAEFFKIDLDKPSKSLEFLLGSIAFSVDLSDGGFTASVELFGEEIGSISITNNDGITVIDYFLEQGGVTLMDITLYVGGGELGIDADRIMLTTSESQVQKQIVDEFGDPVYHPEFGFPMYETVYVTQYNYLEVQTAISFEIA